MILQKKHTPRILVHHRAGGASAGVQPAAFLVSGDPRAGSDRLTASASGLFVPPTPVLVSVITSCRHCSVRGCSQQVSLSVCLTLNPMGICTSNSSCTMMVWETLFHSKCLANFSRHFTDKENYRFTCILRQEPFARPASNSPVKGVWI